MKKPIISVESYALTLALSDGTLLQASGYSSWSAVRRQFAEWVRHHGDAIHSVSYTCSTVHRYYGGQFEVAVHSSNYSATEVLDIAQEVAA